MTQGQTAEIKEFPPETAGQALGAASSMRQAAWGATAWLGGDDASLLLPWASARFEGRRGRWR